MEKITGYWKAKLGELIEEIGEERVRAILSSFSCPLNPDVESFLKYRAIEFEKTRFSTTYLVFTSHKGEAVLAGYYALASKTLIISAKALNSEWKRRMQRYAELDSQQGKYLLSLPLIGQLGKNFTNGYNNLMAGEELLNMACETVKQVLSMSSGKMAYLECSDNEKLVTFYQRYGFQRFQNRNLDRDETDETGTHYLVQMVIYFKN